MHVNKKGAGLYSYPRSLTSAFIDRLLESIMSKLASCKISFKLVSVAEQTGLGLTSKDYNGFEVLLRNQQDRFVSWP